MRSQSSRGTGLQLDEHVTTATLPPALTLSSSTQPKRKAVALPVLSLSLCLSLSRPSDVPKPLGLTNQDAVGPKSRHSAGELSLLSSHAGPMARGDLATLSSDIRPQAADLLGNPLSLFLACLLPAPCNGGWHRPRLLSQPNRLFRPRVSYAQRSQFRESVSAVFISVLSTTD